MVRVNDRGHFSGADLEVSQAAAEYIGLTANATLDIANADPSTPTRSYTGDATSSPAGGGEKTQPQSELAASQENCRTRRKARPLARK